MSTRIPKRPYNTKLITRAAIKAEYLARGPKFSTACDSNSPGVSENNVWDASSGRNGPPTSDLMRSEWLEPQRLFQLQRI
ncbi:MAG: hypothetical protein ABJB85_06590 [Nitrososphaerota archaeon]